MAKNRRKKRRKQRSQASVPPLPRPSRARNQGAALRPDAAVASAATEPALTHKVGDIVSGTVTDIDDSGWLWLDVDGLVGSVRPDELDFKEGESARNRYAVGQPIEGLFVLWVDHKARELSLSLKRNAPSYVEALNAHRVGDIAAGIVTGVGDDWLWLDVDGLVGFVGPRELDQTDGKSARERYAVGKTIDDLFVWSVNHKDRDLSLSVERGAPGYVEALEQRAVGDVASATIAGFWGSGHSIGLDVRLNADGLVGEVGPQELDLADDESAQERYAVGETIESLFVRWVDHETRVLHLSVKRNAPGYMQALQRHVVGDVVSGTVAAFQGNRGLWLEVDGVVGALGPQELGLAEDESARERYAVGETIDGLFVRWINHEARDIHLSLKRDALDMHSVGNITSGVVTYVYDDGGLRLNVDGVTGWMGSPELPLTGKATAQERYAVGETIDDLFIWHINHEDRALHLSVKRNAPGYVEALRRRAVGDVMVMSATVTHIDDNWLWLDVDGLVGFVGPQELDLDDGNSVRERYAIGDPVENLFVQWANHEARELSLSLKRGTHGYVELLDTHGFGDIVSGGVTYVYGDGSLQLNVDGLVGFVAPQEIDLNDRNSARERYVMGEPVKGLFVRWVDHEARELSLSLKRNTPGYVEALNTHSPGEIVSGTVAAVSDAGVWIDVGGVIGWAEWLDLMLGDRASMYATMQVGDEVKSLVVGIDYEQRELALLVPPTSPDYVNALRGYNPGETVAGVVLDPPEDDADHMVLDVQGVIGFVPSWELPPSHAGPSRDSYAVSDVVEALVITPILEGGLLWLSVRRDTPRYVDAFRSRRVGTEVNGVVEAAMLDGLLVDAEGVSAVFLATELRLATGQSPMDRYRPGDKVKAFVSGINDLTRDLLLSTRHPGRGQRRQQQQGRKRAGRRRAAARSIGGRGERSAPHPSVRHADSIATPNIGDIISGTVMQISSLGVRLDVDGKLGIVPPHEMALADGESPHDKWSVNEVIETTVTHVGLDGRALALSVRRRASTYIDDLATYKVGKIVSCIVTAVYGQELFVDVGNVSGIVFPNELHPAHGQPPTQYRIGEPIDALVLRIDQDAGRLVLSVRRCTEAYLDSFAKCNVGDIVKGTVTAIARSLLRLDVNGVIGMIRADELGLADGESPRARYSVNDTIEAFVWQADRNQRTLSLSVDRARPDYREALASHDVDDVVSATVTDVADTGIWLRVGEVVGWIAANELSLAGDQSPSNRYTPGDLIDARVWQIDHNARDLVLSVRRLAPEFQANPITLRDTIDALVVADLENGITVLVRGREVMIQNYALSLSVGERDAFDARQPISVFVLEMDEYGQPTMLSYRRALAEWEATVDRLAPNVIVQNAQVIPWDSRPKDETQAMLDLGPITGFIPSTERDAEAAERLMKGRGNEELPVVITTLNRAVGYAEVSETKFAARWAELAANVSVGESMEAELRRVTRDKAILDLGSGLQAEMPREQIPTIEHAGERHRAPEGETFLVLITKKDETEHFIVAEHPNQWLVEMIGADENLKCEFKAVYRGPKRRSKQRYAREVRSGLPVLRAMAALMNQQGGYVLVGIEDTDKKEGGIIGWQASGFPNQNRLTTDLGRNIKDLMLTPTAATSYEASFNVLPTGEEVLAIKCDPATVPVYIKNTLDDRYEFPLRRDASTQVAWPLDEEEQMRELRRHFADRWPDEDPEALWNDFQRRARTRPSEDRQQSG